MNDNIDPVQRLVDVEAIKQLKARYFRFLDTKRWDDWGMVFATDVVMEVPEADMVNNGRAEVVQTVSAALEGARTVHHGHMPEIEVTGAGTAHGTWAMFDYLEWPASADGARVAMNGYGHYIEDYVSEEDGEWRISGTRLVRLRVDPIT